MKNLKIGKKLIVVFGVVVVFFLSSVAMGLVGMGFMADSLSEFYLNSYEVVKTTLTMQRGFQEAEKMMVIAFIQPSRQMALIKMIKCTATLAEVHESIPVLESKFVGQQHLIEEFKDILSKGALVREEITRELNDQKLSKAQDLYQGKYAAIIEEANNKLGEISEIAQQSAAQAYHDGLWMQQTAFILLSAVSLGSLIFILIFCTYIIRSLTKPLRELEAAAYRMANGELDVQIRYSSRDELGNLANGMRSMMSTLWGYIGNISEVLGRMAQGDMTATVELEYVGDYAPIKVAMEEIISSLNQTLTDINQAAEQVASGSAQVASGAQALSHGATEQAGTVEELSATVAEISGRIKQNAQSAQQTNSKAQETGEVVEHVNRHMTLLVGAMEDIAKSSTQIERIIKTIDDIAFQTNILALNAAVEAARAGAAGKGFAVVAGEVRSLAAKSAEAARNTGDLIAESVSIVNKGSSLVTETARALAEVKEKAQDTIRLVSEISKASNEQANAVMQITDGIEHISTVVQTNSATAEQSAAASEELNSQAQLLKDLVDRFDLG